MRTPRPDLGPIHPFNDAIVGIYLTGKEQAMHRRAQKAEAELAAARRDIEARKGEVAAYRLQLKTAANRERKQRRRANRLHAFVDIAERMQRARDPLYRIIAIGREFP